MPAWMLAGVVGSALVVALVVAMTITRKFSLLVGMGGLLFFSAMALPVEWDDSGLRPTVWLGIQDNRDLFYGLFGIMTIGLLMFQLPRLVGKRKSMVAMTLVVIGVFMSLLRFIHEGASDAILSLGLALTALPALLLAPAAVIDDEEDVHSLLRWILLANAAWFGMCMVQFVIDRSLLVFGNSNRFVGLMSNPQHAGTFLACVTTTSLFMALNEPKKLWRFAAIGMLAVDVLLVLWTGSRTSLGMAVVGGAGVLLTRMGRAVLMLPIVAAFFAIAMKVLGSGFSESTTTLERLSSGEDTRTAAWARMLHQALENPLLGAGISNAGSSENAWLFGFASYGIGMLGLSLLLTLVAGMQLLKAFKSRWGLPKEQQTVIDLSAGLVLAFFAGAVFEGFFSARISPNLVFVMIFSGVLARLLQLSEQRLDDRVAYADAYDEFGDYGEDADPADQADGEQPGWDGGGAQPAALW